MIEDKNDIRSNTKTTELRESRDNVYTMLMSTFELMIDAMSSAKVIPRNDMAIIVSIQKIQNNLRELEVTLTNGLPDISSDGCAPSRNPELIQQIISPRIRIPKEEQLDGYRPVNFGEVVDEKNHVDDLAGLYTVILTYDKKRYYMDTILTNVLDTVCLRLFNSDGYLVGYVTECLLTIDAATKSIDSSVHINDNDKSDIEKIFGHKNNMFGDREKCSVGIQRTNTRHHGSIPKEKTKDKQNNLPEYTDIKRENIHELLIGDLSNKIAADLIFKRDIGHLLHVFKNTSYQYSRNEFENMSILKVKGYMIHEAYILITLNSFKNEDLETYASILRFFVNVLSDLYITDYTGETYIHLVRSLSAWLHNSGKPHKFKHIHAKNILAILDQPGVFDKRRKNQESKQEMITNLKNDIAELESELG